ncbi:hypothetical protein [Streptomyces celluloflavus]|uniref:hypothetical protein n=1 Tax=Streptomyces celluloflavus TaxID=58344 RepID=UPI0036AAD56E
MAVAREYTRAYYTYDWRTQTSLDPVTRSLPYGTAALLETLRPLSQAFPLRMRAAQETSAATVSSAARAHDAPGDNDHTANVTVTYTQNTTDHGRKTQIAGSWNLQLVQTAAGQWRVDAVTAQD